MSKDNKEIIKPIEGALLTEKDIFLLKTMDEDIVKGIERIENVAKILTGAVSGATALFTFGKQVMNLAVQAANYWQKAAIICLCVSIVVSILVQFPLRYKYTVNSPASIEKRFRTISLVKWILLLISTLLFCAGIIILVMMYV